MAMPNVKQMGFPARVVYGTTIIDRMSATDAPKAKGRLARFFTAFKSVQSLYAKAVDAADAAREKWYEVARVVFDADVLRDLAIDALADTIPSAKLGSRAQPFKAFSKYSPSKLKKLSYKLETTEVGHLVEKILAKKPPAPVRAAANKAIALGKPVDAAIKKLAAPRRDFESTQRKREKIETTWLDAFEHFRKQANADWQDEAGAFTGVFQAVDAAQKPKKRPRVKKAKAAKKGSAKAAASPSGTAGQLTPAAVADQVATKLGPSGATGK